MSANPLPASIYQFPAVIKPLSSVDSQGGWRIRIYSANGEFDALSWMPTHTYEVLYGRVLTGTVTVGSLEPEGDRCVYAALGFRYDDHMSLDAIVSPETCPIYGVAEQTLGLIAQINSPALRRFVEHALTLDGAFPHFWTCPASLRDHHAQAGGLALHSLEVATMVASAANLSTEMRDIGVAMALLHDLGKVWAYEDGSETREAQALGHERMAYNRLGSAFTELSQDDGSLGLTMQALLGGEWRNGARKKRLAIGSVVNAFDQMSCENARGRRGRSDACH